MSKYNCELILENRNSLSLLINRISSNSTVLEFGPANGRMTKYLKEELNCKVYAVEIDEGAAKDTSKYTEKIVIDNIENYSWQQEFKNVQFDYIVFADILEHLYYPEKVLSSVKEFLKNDGSILISIPNISHNAIIAGLLKDEFNYSTTGLLDNTHIRFYTKKTFDKLIKKCGYFRAFETAVFLAIENTEFKYKYNEFPKQIGKYLSELSHGEVFQLIYELKKNKTELVSDFKEEYKKDKSKFIQLFPDTGNGYSEGSSLKLNFENQTILQFDIYKYENLKTLRFDPLNNYCVVKINHILVDGIELTAFGSNACYIENNIYYFNTNDPQIYLETLRFGKIKKIVIEIEYIHIGESSLKPFIKDLLKALTYKEQNIQSLNSKLTDIYTSKSWKVTRPLRNLVRKIETLKK